MLDRVPQIDKGSGRDRSPFEGSATATGREPVYESVIARLVVNQFERLSFNESSAKLWLRFCAESNIAEDWSKLYYPACETPKEPSQSVPSPRALPTSLQSCRTALLSPPLASEARLRTKREKEQCELLSRKSSFGASEQSET
jgi:hypothetical protein